MLRMPGHSYEGLFLPLSPEETHIRNQLLTDIHYLARTLGERNIWFKNNLDNAADFIEQQFKNAGCHVTSQNVLFEKSSVKNIIGEKIGTDKKNEIIIVGAHYDSVLTSPGADDNASGVAGILALAKILSPFPMSRTIRFVGFVNEEPPFFFTHDMGSWKYAKYLYQQKENIVAMLSIESIGFYSEQNKSQNYPFPFMFFYPDKANFIGFVGNMRSRALVHQLIGSFRKYTPFPSEGISAPWWIPGIAWSDQWPFWKFGFPAVMVTGSALYRNPNYHLSTDSPDTLDYERTARVVWGLSKCIFDLAV